MPPVFAYYSSYMLNLHSRQDLVWGIVTSELVVCTFILFSSWPALVRVRQYLMTVTHLA